MSANPYVAILGKPETSSSRLTLTQAFNSLGTTIAPLFGSLLILSVAAKSAEELAALSPSDLTAYQLAEAASVQVPYLGLAASLFVIAAIFAFLKLPVVEAVSAQAADGTAGPADQPSAWKYPHLVLGAVAIFVYVGGEVAIGSFLVNFLGQPEIGGLTAADAGRYLSFYWGGAMVGRFIGAAVMRVIRPGRVLAFNACVAAILVLTTMVTTGHVSMWAILAVGLFNSIMFPTIFTLAVDGLGRHTGQGSGILCMAIVGGAIIPVIQGAFADAVGIQHAFFVPILLLCIHRVLRLQGPRPYATGVSGSVDMETAVTLGIDIGGTNTALGYVDQDGVCLAESSIATNAEEAAAFLVARLSVKAGELFAPLEGQCVVKGIGIGAPNANYHHGTVVDPPNLSWKGETPLVALMKERFGMPVVVTNDANAAALGEMRFGAARGMRDFIVITLGTGLGSGIVCNGALVYGADGFAGEVGHTKVDLEGRLCGCGHRGCLETYASATGICRTVFELLCNGRDDSRFRGVSFKELTAKDVADAARRGRPGGARGVCVHGAGAGRQAGRVGRVHEPGGDHPGGRPGECRRSHLQADTGLDGGPPARRLQGEGEAAPVGDAEGEWRRPRVRRPSAGRSCWRHADRTPRVRRPAVRVRLDGAATTPVARGSPGSWRPPCRPAGRR